MRKSATNSVNHYSRSFSVFRMHSAFGMALGMVYLIFSTKKLSGIRVLCGPSDVKISFNCSGNFVAINAPFLI